MLTVLLSDDLALDKLNQLSEFELHSIEQPIQKNNTDRMAELCKMTPFPIALDEELIGVFSLAEKEAIIVKNQAAIHHFEAQFRRWFSRNTRVDFIGRKA